MIFSGFFKKALFISLLGHITVFTVFSFSFGPRIPKANFSNISFLGAILPNLDLTPSLYTRTLIRKPDTLVLDKVSRESTLVSREYLKPPVILAFNTEKKLFAQQDLMLSWVAAKRKEPAIMFYPKLPYHFALYFRDRQSVHIELEFKIISSAGRNTAVIKRKISSGNLEADLLSMRYIGHYLFIQQAGQVTNKWQTVKIDLSAKEY